MDIIISIIQGILVLAFLFFGYQILTAEPMKKGFQAFGYSDGFRIFTALAQWAAAVLLIVGFWEPFMGKIGAGILAVIMMGAIGSHMKAKHPIQASTNAFVFLVLSLVVLLWI